MSTKDKVSVQGQSVQHVVTDHTMYSKSAEAVGSLLEAFSSNDAFFPTAHAAVEISAGILKRFWWGNMLPLL